MIVVRNNTEDLEKNLSANFKGREFRCKCGKCQITIISGKLLFYCEILRRLWNGPIVITSGYRCQEHNRSINNSAPYSWHMSGHAADFALPLDEIEKERFTAFCKATFPWSYEGSTFIHCDTRGQ